MKCKSLNNLIKKQLEEFVAALAADSPKGIAILEHLVDCEACQVLYDTTMKHIREKRPDLQKQLDMRDGSFRGLLSLVDPSDLPPHLRRTYLESERARKNRGSR